MRIGSIVNGIVIDHIPAGRGMELYGYLGLEHLESEVAIIKNASSIKMGKKDIIKISEIFDINLDILGFIYPHITVDIIKDGKLAQKRHPKLPNKLTGVIKCKNPRCITSAEPTLTHAFKLTDPEHGVYRCIYCETRWQNPNHG